MEKCTLETLKNLLSRIWEIQFAKSGKWGYRLCEIRFSDSEGYTKLLKKIYKLGNYFKIWLEFWNSSNILKIKTNSKKLYLLIQIFGESLWCWNLKTSHNWRNLQQQSFLLRKSSHLIFGWWRDPPEKGRFRNLWKVTDWWRFLDSRLYIICWVVKGWF